MTRSGPDRARAAVEVLFRQHVRAARAYARRFFRDEDAIHDVTQEVFVIAFNRCVKEAMGLERTLLLEGDPGQQQAWLRAVTRHMCLQRLAKDGRAVPMENVDVGAAPAAFGPLEQAVDRDMLERLWKVLDEHATPRERVIVVLAFGEGMTSREISDRLGIAIGTVRSHKHKIKKKIQDTVRGIMFAEDLSDGERRIGGGQ